MAEFYNGMAGHAAISKRELEVGGAAVLGGAIAALQTIILREFVDTPMAKAYMTNTSNAPPLLMKQLKGFGSPSALAGMGAGSVALILGLAASLKGKLIKNAAAAMGLLSYGVVAVSTGIFSGVLPATAWQAGLKVVDPSNPIADSGINRQLSANVKSNANSGSRRLATEAQTLGA